MYKNSSWFFGITELNHEARRFIFKAFSIMFVYVFIIMLSNTFLILHSLEYLSLIELGIILGVQFFIQALTDYPTGAIGDWIGQRYVLFFSSLCFSISFLFFAIASDFFGFIVAFSLLAIAQGQESGTFLSWFDNNYKVYTKEEDLDRRIYSELFGKFTMVYEIITALSFIIGGFLIAYSSRQNMFLVQAILLTGISFLFILKIRDHSTITRRKMNFRGYFNFLGDGIKVVVQNKSIRLIVLGLAISGAGFTTWAGLILFPMYQEYGQSDEWTAILRAIIFVFGAIMVGVAGIISKRIYNLRKWLSLAIISTDILFFVGMFTMLTINPAPEIFAEISFVIVIIFFTFAFLPRFFADVLKPRFFLDLVPDKNRNAIYSLIPTIILALSVIYLPLGGYLLEIMGREQIILLLAINGFIGSAITAIAIYRYTPLEKVDKKIDQRGIIFPVTMIDAQSYIPTTIPCCWTFQTIEQQISGDLTNAALSNNIVTAEQKNLINKIMLCVKEFGDLLENALTDGIIDDTERKQFTIFQEKVWDTALTTAYQNGMNPEKQKILDALKVILHKLKIDSKSEIIIGDNNK